MPHLHMPTVDCIFGDTEASYQHFSEILILFSEFLMFAKNCNIFHRYIKVELAFHHTMNFFFSVPIVGKKTAMFSIYESKTCMSSYNELNFSIPIVGEKLQYFYLNFVFSAPSNTLQCVQSNQCAYYFVPC